MLIEWAFQTDSVLEVEMASCYIRSKITQGRQDPLSQPWAYPIPQQKQPSRGNICREWLEMLYSFDGTILTESRCPGLVYLPSTI